MANSPIEPHTKTVPWIHAVQIEELSEKACILSPKIEIPKKSANSKEKGINN